VLRKTTEKSSKAVQRAGPVNSHLSLTIAGNNITKPPDEKQLTALSRWIRQRRLDADAGGLGRERAVIKPAAASTVVLTRRNWQRSLGCVLGQKCLQYRNGFGLQKRYIQTRLPSDARVC
jgi:hypothetical protein